MTTPQPGAASAGGPTALRMLLGAQLRQLRERQGFSRAEAGWEIRASESKISRLELGRVSFKERDVEDLLKLYGVAGEENERLLTLVQDANTPGWWHRFNDILPTWFSSYLGLEATASLIRTYEVQFIPGLLQTRDYARAVIMLGHAHSSPQEINRRVDLRISRQRMLTGPSAPLFWVVIDEAALRRPIGGREVMQQQLRSLIEVANLPNVRLQIVPFEVGGHPAAGGAFTMLRFNDQELPDIVYIEQMTSALYLDKRDDVEQYATSMDHLCVEAETPDRSSELLMKLLSEFENH